MIEQPASELLGRLDRAGRRLGFASTMRNQAAAQLVGLHPTDWQALDLLDAIGPTPVGTLGRRLGLSRSAATALVDRLEVKSLLARRTTGDRRVTEVVPLNQRGRDYDDIDVELRDAMANLVATFAADELQTVLRFMEAATDVLLETTAKMRERHTNRNIDQART